MRIATGGSDNFVKRAEAANLPAHVPAVVAPLFESLKMLNRQIAEADAELEKIVKQGADLTRGGGVGAAALEERDFAMRPLMEWDGTGGGATPIDGTSIRPLRP